MKARLGIQAFACGLAVLAAALAGCGDGSRTAESGGGNATAAPPPSAEAPKSGSGELWAIDPQAGRDAASAAAALTAFAWGLQVVVIDGDSVYLGLKRVTAKPGAGGARTVRLSDSLEATLTPAGEQMTLAFSNGQQVALQRRRAPVVRGRS